MVRPQTAVSTERVGWERFQVEKFEHHFVSTLFRFMALCHVSSTQQRLNHCNVMFNLDLLASLLPVQEHAATGQKHAETCWCTVRRGE